MFPAIGIGPAHAACVEIRPQGQQGRERNLALNLEPSRLAQPDKELLVGLPSWPRVAMAASRSRIVNGCGSF